MHSLIFHWCESYCPCHKAFVIIIQSPGTHCSRLKNMWPQYLQLHLQRDGTSFPAPGIWATLCLVLVIERAESDVIASVLASWNILPSHKSHLLEDEKPNKGPGGSANRQPELPDLSMRPSWIVLPQLNLCLGAHTWRRPGEATRTVQQTQRIIRSNKLDIVISHKDLGWLDIKQETIDTHVKCME